MKWVPGFAPNFYNRLVVINGRVFGVIGSVVYTALYMCIVPVAVLVARKKIAARIVSGWQPWLLRSDSLEDVQKQY